MFSEYFKDQKFVTWASYYYCIPKSNHHPYFSHILHIRSHLKKQKIPLPNIREGLGVG